MTSVLLDPLNHLSTAHLADACIEIGVEVRCAPYNLKGLIPSMRCAGRVRPARHADSVDVFLEALGLAETGDVLVIDDNGRKDAACIGDLITLEAAHAGLAGIIIWGCHRDTPELLEIGLPVFSLGAMPRGPHRVAGDRPDLGLDRAQVGSWTVGPNDFVAADMDGVLFLPDERLAEVIDAAGRIKASERQRVEAMREGRTFREQVAFDQYLSRRELEPELTFRNHLRDIRNGSN